MTAPAPDAPEPITVARFIGSGDLEIVPHGHTMSMGYVDPVKYVRADLSASPAQPVQEPVAYDECLNDLGWKMNDFLTSNGAKFDGRVFNHIKPFLRGVIEQWITAHPTPAPVADAEGMREALEALLHAVCGDSGFAACVRKDSGTAYPWPALDLAEARAIAALRQQPAPQSDEAATLRDDARVPDHAAWAARGYWNRAYDALREDHTTLRAELAEAEKRITELGDELCDAQNGPWPQWAASILKTLQDFGYRYDDLIDLPSEVESYLLDYPDSATAGLIEQRDDAIARAEAAEDAHLAAEDHADVLAEALTFYADEAGDGYDVMVTNYGLSIDNGDIIKDDGQIAKAALAAHQARRAGE